MKIVAYSKNYFNEFLRLFGDYYAELGCDDNVNELVSDYVLEDFNAELLKIDLAVKDGITAGFIIYQTDGIENDWNFKEGWGDIREIFVLPEYRKCGFGKQLLLHAESELKAKQIYLLPEEGAEAFFIKCGYADGGDYNCELDSKVFEKLL